MTYWFETVITFALTATLLGVCLVSLGSCWEGYTDDGEYHNTYSDLRDIPRDIPAEARKVFLHWNQISYVRAGAFDELAECTELDLHKNEITKVDLNLLLI